MNDEDFEGSFAVDESLWISENYHKSVDLEILTFAEYCEGFGMSPLKINQKSECWNACLAVYAMTSLVYRAYNIEISQLTWNTFSHGLTVRMAGGSDHQIEGRALKDMATLDKVVGSCLGKRPVEFSPLVEYFAEKYCTSGNQERRQALLAYFSMHVKQIKESLLPAITLIQKAG